MNLNRKILWRKSFARRAWALMAGAGMLLGFGAGFPVRALASQASAQPAPVAGAQAATPAASGTAGQAPGQTPDQQPAASISGKVATPLGGPVLKARVTLAHNGWMVEQVRTARDGRFFFAHVAPGTYHLNIVAPGFKKQSVSVVKHAGQAYSAPPIVLKLARVVTSIEVRPARGEVARYQVQQEEKQLVLGFIPNYLVNYYPHPAPLSARQKFQLTWKTVFNPFTLGLTTAFVGGEQATGMYRGYGTEEKSFVKRFGASYATLGVGAFVGDALLPSVLKQDPRFYYKKSGSVGSRFLYAITRSVICKGDNGHWQPDYSAVLGHFAAGGVANLYLPKQNRNGWRTTMENGLIGIGFDAFADVLQEFVIPKFTPALSHRKFGKP